MIDGQIRAIVRRKVAELIGQAGFTHQDFESLEQELITRVLQRLPLFDPAKGHRNQFVKTVVERHSLSILRDRRTGKRDHRRIGSLNVEVEVGDEGRAELADLISDRELDSRLGRNRRSDQELASLANDMATLIARLPADWQRLLELRRTHSMDQISVLMKVPRTTLNGWMGRIRERCEQHNLRNYL